VCAPVGGEQGGGTSPAVQTSPSASSACPFMQDTKTTPNWGPSAPQPGHPEDGHPEDRHSSTTSIPMGGAGTPLHWEPLQRVGAAPQHTPQECTGWGDTHSTLLQTGKQRGMCFQSKVPRSTFGRGAGWELGLCEDCPRAGDRVVLAAGMGGFSHLAGTQRG